jgi:hypothetical protein
MSGRSLAGLSLLLENQSFFEVAAETPQLLQVNKSILT